MGLIMQFYSVYDNSLTFDKIWLMAHCQVILIIGERAKRARHSHVCTIENREYIMVCAISVYSAGVPYAARFTAAVKIPLPLATFQF